MTRRMFVAAVAAGPLAAGARLPIKKAVLLDMLPKNLSYADKFKMAGDVGFEAVECNTTPDERVAEEIKKASEAAKVPIHSVMNEAHWKFPLSSADPAVVAESMKGMETSLRNAALWGASTVLLVPAVVNPETRYQDAWTRSIRQIHKLLPLAAQLKVIIAVENVGNKFLLSPLEFASYVDQYKSPWLRAYLDIGNVVGTQTGYPQDWVRTLGKRIVKLHLKGFKLANVQPDFPAVREQQIDWPAVYQALAEVGFRGTATTEVNGGNEAYLREVSRRVDAILTGS